MSSRKFKRFLQTSLTLVSMTIFVVVHDQTSAAISPNKNLPKTPDVNGQTPITADAILEVAKKPFDFCDVDATKAHFDAITNMAIAQAHQAMMEGRPPQNTKKAIADIVEKGTDDGSINDTPPIVDEYISAQKRGDTATQQDLLKKMTPLEQARAAQVQHDWSLAIGILTPLADGGDADAQVLLASLYSLVGRPFIKMGEQARASLPPKLSSLFCQTNCLPPENETLALKYDRLAAANGNADGQEGLALAYSCGLGTDKDYMRAYAWFSLELAQRVVSIQTNWAPADILQRRDFIAKQMTPEQIQHAKVLLIQCHKSNYQKCD